MNLYNRLTESIIIKAKKQSLTSWRQPGLAMGRIFQFQSPILFHLAVVNPDQFSSDFFSKHPTVNCPTYFCQKYKISIEMEFRIISIMHNFFPFFSIFRMKLFFTQNLTQNFEKNKAGGSYGTTCFL